MSISQIAEDAPKSEVRKKLNELIEFINASGLKPKAAPPPQPAPWSQSSGKQQLGKWRLNTNNPAFATNREGVDILIRKMTTTEQHEFQEDTGEAIEVPEDALAS